jgi:hypothetical protein
VSPPHATFAGGTLGATSEVREVLRTGRAQTGCIVNDPVAPAVAVVTNDAVAYPVIFLKIPVATEVVDAEGRMKGGERLAVVVRLS